MSASGAFVALMAFSLVGTWTAPADSLVVVFAVLLWAVRSSHGSAAFLERWLADTRALGRAAGRGIRDHARGACNAG